MVLRDIFFTPLYEVPVIAGVLGLVAFVALFWAVWRLRLRYVRYRFLERKISWTLLELIIPRELKKSPEAMEVFISNALWWPKGGGKNFYKKFIKGEMLLTFSLEICSFGGDIHFFIQTPTHLKDNVQAQMYAQYPQVEVREVDDYTDRIPQKLRDEMGMAMFAWEYKFKKEQCYSIKTYRDLGLDKKIEMLDEEQQIDPLTSIIERIAVLDPWEEIWLQYVVRVQKDDGWREEGERIIDKTITSHRRTVKKEEAGTPLVSTLTKNEQEVVEGIEHKIDTPQPFEVGIRSIFITNRSDAFRIHAISHLQHLFAPFNSESMNSFKITNPSGYDNPWQDFQGKFEYWMKDRALERYRHRWFFNEKPLTYTMLDVWRYIIGDYRRETMVMSPEELATLFHFPAGFGQAPSIERSEIRKTQPPSNLPI
jgi:hypothetical protein